MRPADSQEWVKATEVQSRAFWV